MTNAEIMETLRGLQWFLSKLNGHPEKAAALDEVIAVLEDKGFDND